VGVKDAEGKPLVQDRHLTSFTNEEEDAVQLSSIVPFLLESRLKENGALFSKASVFQPHVVVDGNLVTGQNPSSSVEAADATMKLASK
jgi:putative intracellular protease/amidase